MATEDYRRAVCELIEIADLNDDHEVVIVGEDILKDIMSYRKQADIWATEAKDIAITIRASMRGLKLLQS